MTRVKICGLKKQEDVNFCVQAGIHMLGFVVEYPVSVPWNLKVSDARELIEKVPPFVSTCVVTGGEVKSILDIVNKTCPDAVQLHYKETLEDVEEITRQLKPKGIKVIKALRMNSMGSCDFEITDPVMAAKELLNTGISAILLDSYTSSMPGGTGVAVDLSIFEAVHKVSTIPVILAGGLNADNIAKIVGQVKPYAVDVLTGVEDKPNEKNYDKIKALLSNIIG